MSLSIVRKIKTFFLTCAGSRSEFYQSVGQLWKTLVLKMAVGNFKMSSLKKLLLKHSLKLKRKLLRSLRIAVGKY